MKHKKSISQNNVIIEVFKTNVSNSKQAEDLKIKIENSFPELKINFDLENSEFKFPCSHNILRVEGNLISSENIISLVNTCGFTCAVLEDKICL